MFRPLKKLLTVCAALTCTALVGFSQEEIVGNDAPQNFGWKSPDANDTAFRFIALDGKSRAFYVNKGAFFAPIEISGRNIGRLYSIPSSGDLVLYTRKEIPNGPKGKALYVAVEKINLKNSKDWIIAIYNAGNDIRTNTLDYSLDNMPLGSFTMLNANPKTMGFQVNKASVKLGFFTPKIYKASTDPKRIITNTVNAFDLSGAKPEFIASSSYSYWTDQRLLVIFFEAAKAEKSMGIPSTDPPASGRIPDSASGNAPTLVQTSRGPR